MGRACRIRMSLVAAGRQRRALRRTRRSATTRARPATRTAYLTLNRAASVSFQYVGKGDSSLSNSFQVFKGGNRVTLFDIQTGACGAPAVSLVCTPGVNQFRVTFSAGYVPFRFVTGKRVGLQLGFDAAVGKPIERQVHDRERGAQLMGSVCSEVAQIGYRCVQTLQRMIGGTDRDFELAGFGWHRQAHRHVVGIQPIYFLLGKSQGRQQASDDGQMQLQSWMPR